MNVAEEFAAAYALDAAMSRFLVRATATGMLSAFGHNPTIAIRSFSGEAVFRPKAPERSSLRIKIDAASLTVTGNASDKDRREMEHSMREEVLETAYYPEITFESTGIQANKVAPGMYRMQIAGTLTLHGVAREIEIPCNVNVGEDGLRANGEFTIRQTDFHIRPVSAAGGTIKLKDELKFTFDIVGHRKKEVGNA
jgi:polyisoprenoid-binding protein YceI